MAETDKPVRCRLDSSSGPEISVFIEDAEGDYAVVPFPQVALQDQMLELQLEITKLRGAMVRASRNGY